MGMSDEAFEVTCPDCGAMLKVDPVTRAIIAHTPAPRKRTFEDFGAAAKAAAGGRCAEGLDFCAERGRAEEPG